MYAPAPPPIRDDIVTLLYFFSALTNVDGQMNHVCCGFLNKEKRKKKRKKKCHGEKGADGKLQHNVQLKINING